MSALGWAIAPELALPVAGVLGVAAVLATVRLLYRQRRAGPSERSRGWRVALLVAAQPLCAALLYLALLPPTARGEAGTLIVATAHASAARLIGEAGGDVRVALPEAPALRGIDRVPDLATALRRHPGTRRLRVVGDGLEARDRDAARGLAVMFDANPLPRGLVELDAPARAQAGDAFRIGGRAHDLRGGVAELLDPGRQRVDRIALGGDGRFTLSATTRVTGAAHFLLRLRDARQRVVEDIEVPVHVVADPAPRVLLLAGAPGPEVKFLRRWARDAGLPMHTRIGVGGGLQLGDAPLALNAATLRRFDLVVLDERAWSALGESERRALDEALRSGLGVIVRITAGLTEPERRRLRALGFDADSGRDAAVVRLPPTPADPDALRARLGPGTGDAPRDREAVLPEPPALTRRTLGLSAPDAVVLLRGSAGEPLGAWRAEGRGRLAVWTLTDSYRLVLAGRGDLHGEIWSQAVAGVARALPRRTLAVAGERRQDERIALCGVGNDARVFDPDGAATAVLVDPAAGPGRCAAFWPRRAGWHRLAYGGDRTQWFHVRAAASAPGLHRQAVRESTQRLAMDATGSTMAVAATAAPRHPGPRWPWWLAWLLASGGLWWFERSRLGRAFPVHL